jgi:hypothetical protein
MDLVCISEINMNSDIVLDEKIKKYLKPGTKVRLKIEELSEKDESKRILSIEYLKKMGESSNLGLFNENLTREDAHHN